MTRLSKEKEEVKLLIQNNVDYPCEVESYYPLSPMQRGILLNYLQDKKQDWYFRQKVFLIYNLKKVNLFKKVWEEIVKTYDIFKTAFFWQGLDDPIQFTSKNIPSVLDFHDISNLEEEKKTSSLESLLLKNREQKFELDKAPLIRGILVKYAEENYYFILTFHHILLDGWSVMELLETIKKSYNDLFKGIELEIKNSVSFQQYISWVQQQDKTNTKEFWKDYIFGSTYSNQFSASFKHTDGSSKGYEVFEALIPSLLYDQIVFLSRDLGLTLNSIMQFAWAVLLAKFTQMKDITFGITTFGRTIELEDAHKVIGLLANVVPFRFQIKDDINIIQGINLIQTQLASIQHQALLPLFEIQSLVGGSSAHSLFDTIFVFENYPKVERSKSIVDLEINSHKNTLDVTEFSLTVGVEPSSDLIMRFGYNKSHFSQENISKIFNDYVRIMEGICANLNQLQNGKKVA